MSPKTRARTWAASISAAVLCVGSALPIWVAWYYSSPGGNQWEGLGYHQSTFWHVLTQLPSNVKHAGPYPGLFELHKQNVVVGAILISIAGVAGFLSYRTLSKHLSA